jgi:hypothetical protein
LHRGHGQSLDRLASSCPDNWILPTSPLLSISRPQHAPRLWPRRF